jgi:hypothetical protein
LTTESPLPTIGRNISDRAPRVSQSALRKICGGAKLGKIQTALLGSIEPVSTGALLLEQNDEWAVQRSRYMTLETIATMSDDPLISLPAAS